MKRNLLSMLLAFVLALEALPAAALAAEGAASGGVPFADVDRFNQYANYIEFVAKRGLFGGSTDGKFYPYAWMTRAAIAQVLYNMEGAEGGSYTGTYADVAADHWFCDAVEWASANGIVTGDSGVFRPNESIIRQELATILYRYAKYKGYDVSVSSDLLDWPDADSVSKYARDAMAWAVDNGVFWKIGRELSPRSRVIRAEVAAMITVFMQMDQTEVSEDNKGTLYRKLDYGVQYITGYGSVHWEKEPKSLWITSKDELDTYCELYVARTYSSASDLSFPDPKFMEMTEKYDDAFFETHDLILIGSPAADPSCSYEVTAVNLYHSLSDRVQYFIQPEVKYYRTGGGSAPSVIVFWHTIIEISKDYGKGVSQLLPPNIQ